VAVNMVDDSGRPLANTYDTVDTDTTTSATLEDIDGLTQSLTIDDSAQVFSMIASSVSAAGSDIESAVAAVIGSEVFETERTVGNANDAGSICAIGRTSSRLSGSQTVKGQHRLATGSLTTAPSTQVSFALAATRANTSETTYEIPSSYSESLVGSTTSASLEDIASLNEDIVLDRTAHVVAFMTLDATKTTAGDADFAISIDGVDHASVTRTFGAGDDGALFIVARTTSQLTAGTYSVRGRWSTTGGTLSMASEGHLVALALEVTESPGAVLEAGAQTVALSAPDAIVVAGEVTLPAGPQTLALSAPDAAVELTTTLGAGSQTVALSAPDTTLVPGVVTLDASANVTAVSAPDATLVTAGAPQNIDAGDQTVAVSSPTATAVGAVSLEASSNAIAVSASDATLFRFDFDAYSESNDQLGNHSWSHTLAAGAKGLLVAVVQTGGTTDVLSAANAVQVGSTNLTRIRFDVDSVGSGVGVYWFFLGSSVPTGSQTITTNKSGGLQQTRCSAWSITASSDTAVDASNATTGDQDDPSITLATTTGRITFVATAFASGLASTGDVTEGGDYTRNMADDAFGLTRHTARRTNLATGGNVTVDWTTASSDDVAMSAVAIGEFTAITAAPAVVAISAPDAVIQTSAASLDAGQQTIATSAPDATVVPGSVSLNSGANVVAVSSPTATLVAAGAPQNISAGSNNVAVSSPTSVVVSGAVSINGGQQTVAVSAPDTVLAATISLSAGSNVVSVSVSDVTIVPGASTVDAGQQTVAVIAPAADVQVAGVSLAGPQVIAVSAPTAVLQAGAVTQSAGSNTVSVSAPSVSLLTEISIDAGSQTVAVVAPDVTSQAGAVSINAGANTVAVVAPVAILQSAAGPQTREAGANTVAVSSPTSALVAGAVSVDAGSQVTTVSAPAAEAVVAGSLLAGANIVSISAPEATSVAGGISVQAGGQVVSVSSPTATLQPGTVSLSAGAQVVALSASTATASATVTLGANGSTVAVSVDTPVVSAGPSSVSAGSQTIAVIATAVSIPNIQNRAAGASVLAVVAPDATVSTVIDSQRSVVLAAVPDRRDECDVAVRMLDVLDTALIALSADPNDTDLQAEAASKASEIWEYARRSWPKGKSLRSWYFNLLAEIGITVDWLPPTGPRGQHGIRSPYSSRIERTENDAIIETDPMRRGGTR
jgi:hypothetical protein